MVIRKKKSGTVETRLLIIQCVARIVVLRPLRLLPEYRPYRYHTAGTDIVVLLTTVSVSVYILCSW